MAKRLVTLALTIVAVFALAPIQTYAQDQTTYSIEEYDFGPWTNKTSTNQTLSNTTGTSTSGSTVYLLENFLDKDDVNHLLNGRFAFSKITANATENPYGWTKFVGYATSNSVTNELVTCGLQLNGKNGLISIQDLHKGDIITIVHSLSQTTDTSADGLYIITTNATYDKNGTPTASTGAVKTSGNALVSGTEYTMISNGSFDFKHSGSGTYYIRKVTIKKKEYTVSAEAGITNGSVTFCKTADGEYTSTLKACEGETVYVKAQAAESYKLATLTSGDLESLTTSEATSFTMPRKDVTISAIFEESNTPRYTLTINTPTNGQIKIGDNPATTQSYEENATITLTAEANIGYEFEKWQVKVGNEDFADVTGDNEDNIESVNGSTLTVKMTKDFMVSAVFKTTTYNITYNLSDGTNNQDNPLTYTIESNDITLQAPTKEGYTFTGWTWAGQETPEMNVTIAQGSTGNREYTANWSQDSAKPKVTVSVSDANSGTIKYIAKVDNKDTAKDFPNEGLEIDENGSVTLVAVPASSSYRLKSWNVGGVDKGNSLKLELSEITSDVSVSAEFESQSAVTAITTAKTWTFDSFTAKTELSGTASYEYQGLFINGNNNELTNLATAEVSGASAIEGEVSFEAPTSRVVLNGSLPTSNFDASNSKVNTIGNRNKNSVAFQAGVAGTVYVYMNGTYASDRNLCIYSSDNMSNPTTVALISNPSPQVVQRTVSANANIFIGVSGGTAYIYGVKFVPTPTIETISEVNISGLSAPIKGEELKNLSDLSTSTTGVSISSITWNPTTTPAAASTVYTATIVIEATSGYQFASEVSANAISEKNATITRNSDTQISVAYTFDATAADAISVTANGYSGTFDGAAHGISVTAEEGATITYRTTDSGEYNFTENPTYTNVGSYIVYYKVTKDNCEDVTGSKTVTITRAAGSINAFDPASGSVAMGTTDFAITTNATGDGTITYSSGDENIATINATTGAVTPVAAGTTTITATVTDKDGGNYTYAADSKTATYQLTVTSASVVENLTAPKVARKDNTTITITIGSTDSSETSVTTYYSTDGNDPSESNGTAITQNTDITLDVNCTVKAITISSAGNQSSVASYNYVYVAPVSETIVSTDTKWSFDEVNLVAQEKVIQDLGSGLIYRGNSGASVKDNSKNGTFTDAQSTTWSCTKAIELPAASDNLDGAFANNQRKANANYNGTLARALAFNVSGPGTCYVVFSADDATEGKAFKLFFNYKDGSWTSKSSSMASSTELTEVKLEADREGTFWIYSSQKCYVHSILFVPKKYTITEETSKSHVEYIVSPTTASAGQTITVTASPEDGYYVSSINYTYTEGETTKTATVSTYSEKIATITKEFSMPAYDITMKVGTQKENLSLTAAQVEHGSISFKDKSGNAITTAKIGDQVTVVSSPDENYTLSSLSAVDAKGNSVSIVDNKFTMPAYDVTVTAIFVSTTHSHSFSYAVGEGENSNVLTATCQNTGCGLTENKATLTLTANGVTYNGSPFAATTDLDAFNQTTGLSATCSINYTGDSEYNSSNAPTNVGSYTATATVTIGETNYTLTKTFTISAASVTTYSITLPTTVNGNSVTANVNLSSVVAGTEVTLTITTTENYMLTSISATGVTLSGNSNIRTFTMPSSNVTITANWEAKTTESAKTEVTENVDVVDASNATVTSVEVGNETTTITISGTVSNGTNDVPVTTIAEGTFTADNTANVQSIDLSSTQVSLSGERSSNSVLKDIPENTLVYLPSTSNGVTGDNVIIYDGDGTEASDYTCNNFVMTDKKSYSVPKTFTATNATLSRSFTNGVTCTVCLPYNVPAGNLDGKIYQFSEVDGATVKMTEKTGGLVANTPYIFVPSSNATQITASTVTINMSDTPNTSPDGQSFTFKGIFEHKDFTTDEISGGIYGFAADADHGASVGQFVKASNGAWTEGMRAYLAYSGNLSETGVATTRGEGLPEYLNVVLVSASGNTTNIGRLELMTAEDGSAVYNLSGQRVDSSYKGLVIKNGKKVVKK